MILALFFTRATSLQTWLDRGLFDREKLIYEYHLSIGNLKEVHWLTYGGEDEALARKLKIDGRLDPRIYVHGRPRWIPSGKFGLTLYSLLLPLINQKALKFANVYKSNQLDGAWAAVFARYIFRKPLVLRCGYVQSQLETSLRRLPAWRLKLMLAIERFQYLHTDLAVVASVHNARYIRACHNVSECRIRVLPNYIDEVLFAPNPKSSSETRQERLLYVGRLSLEKNLESLIRAVALVKLPLDIVGSGPMKEYLGKLSAEIGADVHFLGTKPNAELPALINQNRYFALISFFEGMPKALLEAMACGAVCIGTNVDGINEVICDEINGYLSMGTDASAIALAINRARLGNHYSIGNAARRKVIDEYAIEAITQKEFDIFKEVIEINEKHHHHFFKTTET